jgi:hypothetical protein
LQEADVCLLLPRLAQAYLDLDDSSQAATMAAEAVRRTKALHDPDPFMDALRVHGMVLARSGRWEEATDSLEEGVSLARAITYPYIEARILYEWGRMHAGQGKHVPARERLEEALTLFQGLGARPYTQRTRQTLDIMI